MTELLSCPFCGERPEMMGSGEAQRGLMIQCITPGCVNPHTSYYDHASARRVWNCRAAPVPQCGAEPLAWDTGEHEGCGKDSERAYKLGEKTVSLSTAVDAELAVILDSAESVQRRDAESVELQRAKLNHKDVVATKRRTDARLAIALAALQKIYDESCEDNITLIAGEAFEDATAEGSALVSPPSEAGREMVHRTSDAPEQRSGHRAAENAAAQFVMWALMEGSWQGCDIDGGAAQDKAVALGLITETAYDPKIHGESDYCERGESWYLPSKALLAALEASSVENNRTGAAPAPLDIVNIKSPDQGTVAVSSARGNTP